MKSLRILTPVHIANPGDYLFLESAYKNLSNRLPDYDVRALDYLIRKRVFYDWGRIFKIHPRSPLFNLRRKLVSEAGYDRFAHWDRPTRFYPEGYDNMVNFLIGQRYDALVVGKVIWDLTNTAELPHFPHIYWLSEKIPAVKIAYAASGHRSRADFVRENLSQIRRILSSYTLIGVRDQLTLEILHESKVDRDVPVMKVPDPTMMYEFESTCLDEILSAHGVERDRPILGMLFYGKPELSEALADFYRSKGFQIVAFSMYNPFADVNLGHFLKPNEWADMFRRLSICVTDRFHGTIFSLKANIPFLTIEPFAPATILNSKVNSLLCDFELCDECYWNPYDDDFRVKDFLACSEDLRVAWDRDFKRRVENKVDEKKDLSEAFLQKIRNLLS